MSDSEEDQTVEA